MLSLCVLLLMSPHVRLVFGCLVGDVCCVLEFFAKLFNVQLPVCRVEVPVVRETSQMRVKGLLKEDNWMY